MTRAAESGTGTVTAKGCVFCVLEARNEELVVHRGGLCYVILNLYPYNNGHVMVVPNRHIADLAETTSSERVELIELTRLSEMALAEGYRPDGVNVGINLGRTAGAGILEHLHVHLVPRWNGDTNFMGVLAETRVLPEDLAQSAKRLRPVFERLTAEKT